MKYTKSEIVSALVDLMGFSEDDFEDQSAKEIWDDCTEEEKQEIINQLG